MSDKLVEQFKAHLKAELKSQEEALETAKKEGKEDLGKIIAMVDELKKVIDEMTSNEAKSFKGGRQEQKSFGEYVLNEIKSHGGFSKGRSFELKEYVGFERKDVSRLAASAGALVPIWKDPEVATTVRPEVHLSDIIKRVMVGSSYTQYSRQNAGATVAYQGPVANGDGNANKPFGVEDFAQKTETNITYELVDAPLRNLAGFVEVSEQVMTDVPQMQSLIDNDLRDALRAKLENEIINGPGTGQTMTGLLAQPGILTPAAPTVGHAGVANFRAIRKAKASSAKLGHRPDVILIAHETFAELETAAEANGDFIRNPIRYEGDRAYLYGMLVVETAYLAENKYLILATPQLRLYVNAGAAKLKMSDSHGTNFEKNVLAILLEQQFSVGVRQPKSIVYGSLDFDIVPEVVSE